MGKMGWEWGGGINAVHPHVRLLGVEVPSRGVSGVPVGLWVHAVPSQGRRWAQSPPTSHSVVGEQGHDMAQRDAPKPLHSTTDIPKNHPKKSTHPTQTTSPTGGVGWAPQKRPPCHRGEGGESGLPSTEMGSRMPNCFRTAMKRRMTTATAHSSMPCMPAAGGGHRGQRRRIGDVGPPLPPPALLPWHAPTLPSRPCAPHRCLHLPSLLLQQFLFFFYILFSPPTFSLLLRYFLLQIFFLFPQYFPFFSNISSFPSTFSFLPQ